VTTAELCTTVSALFVRADGPYPSLVADWWDEQRDARLYAGPNPVVGHPPCARWGQFWWSAGDSGRKRADTEPGNDDGCFEAAIAAVRRWGGVLEHPAGSHAWPRFGIARPWAGQWTRSMFRPDEWVAVLDQIDYGHRARKRTWLVVVGATVLPRLKGESRAAEVAGRPRVYVASGPGPSRTAESRRLHGIELMGKREKELTPEPFARLLVDLARSAA
jgi:hypothetical protein